MKTKIEIFQLDACDENEEVLDWPADSEVLDWLADNDEVLEWDGDERVFMGLSGLAEEHTVEVPKLFEMHRAPVDRAFEVPRVQAEQCIEERFVEVLRSQAEDCVSEAPKHLELEHALIVERVIEVTHAQTEERVNVVEERGVNPCCAPGSLAEMPVADGAFLAVQNAGTQTPLTVLPQMLVVPVRCPPEKSDVAVQCGLADVSSCTTAGSPASCLSPSLSRTLPPPSSSPSPSGLAASHVERGTEVGSVDAVSPV